MKEASEDPKLKEYIGYTEDQVEAGSSLALFTDTGWIWPRSQAFLPSSFWWIAVCKNGGGRPGLFYHVNERFVNLREAKNILLLVQNEECMCEMRSFYQDPPTSVYLCVCDEINQAFPLHFLQTASDQKLDSGKLWEWG